MTTGEPVYILIHPDGRASWGDRLATAERQLGSHGIGKGFLDATRRLRLAMSDSALLLRDVYEPNPYAKAVMADLLGVHAERLPETRGPITLYGYDPGNEWDSTRPFTKQERDEITLALELADCTVA